MNKYLQLKQILKYIETKEDKKRYFSTIAVHKKIISQGRLSNLKHPHIIKQRQDYLESKMNLLFIKFFIFNHNFLN